MGRKNAMAGINWGGGKGIITINKENPLDIKGNERTEMMLEYGKFISSLCGIYYGAEDSGMLVDDLDIVHTKTKFVNCISPEIGGSANPSQPTALGIFFN